MAAKVQTLVVAALVLTAFAINDSKKKKKIAIDPITAKDAAESFEEALQEEEPMIKEEELRGSPLQSLLKTNLRTNKGAKPAQAPISADVLNSGEWASDFEKDVSNLILGLSAGGLGATPFGDTVQQISDLIEKDMMPKVTNASLTEQNEINALAATVKVCETTRSGSSSDCYDFQQTYLTASPEHKTCRASESELLSGADGLTVCRAQWETDKADKDGKCNEWLAAKDKFGESSNNQDIMVKAPNEEVEDYLTRVTAAVCGTCPESGTTHESTNDAGEESWHGMLDDVRTKRILCEEAVNVLNLQTEKCKDLDHRYHKQIDDCNNIQDQMDTAACDWAKGEQAACDAYGSCYATDHVIYMAKVTLVYGVYNGSEMLVSGTENDRKVEWKGLERMKCLIDSFATPEGAPAVTEEEITACRNMNHSTVHLDIYYPHNNGSYYPEAACGQSELYPSTSEWKVAEVDPLPADAKGKVDEYVCVGMPQAGLTPAEGSPAGCTCEEVPMTGSYSPGDLVKCGSPEAPCLDVYRSHDTNSCPLGTKLWSPRSRLDWDTVLASTFEQGAHDPASANTHPRSPDFIFDVTRADNHAPNAPLNSATSDQNGLPMHRRWMTSDGSAWWLHESWPDYSADANTDYVANCYMTLPVFANGANGDNVTVNVAGSSSSACTYHSDSYYCQPVALTLAAADAENPACTCKKIQLVGTYSAGILLKCEKCKEVRQSTQANSCPTGTKIFSPRTREDWATFLASATPLRAPHWIVDVTKPTDGCTDCNDFAMNSDTPEQKTWVTKDSSPWFLRSQATQGAWVEPSEYKANCYLNLYSFNNEDTIVFESKSSETGTNAEAHASGCEFYSSSYYCQSTRTTTTTTLAAVCQSLPYLNTMCPSGALADNQNTRQCHGNPCEPGGDDDALCCKAKAKCSSLPYTATMCASGTLKPNQTTIECTGPTCHPASADDDICCEAPTCATYNCTTANWAKIAGSETTEQGETPETTCCEATHVQLTMAGSGYNDIFHDSAAILCGTGEMVASESVAHSASSDCEQRDECMIDVNAACQVRVCLRDRCASKNSGSDHDSCHSSYPWSDYTTTSASSGSCQVTVMQATAGGHWMDGLCRNKNSGGAWDSSVYGAFCYGATGFTTETCKELCLGYSSCMAAGGYGESCDLFTSQTDGTPTDCPEGTTATAASGTSPNPSAYIGQEYSTYTAPGSMCFIKA